MSRFWPYFLLGLLAAFIAAGLGLQRQANAELRDEIELLREQHRAVGSLQAEKARRLAAQIPARDLASLRADHAAVVRLRGEIESLQAEVKAREQSLPP